MQVVFWLIGVWNFSSHSVSHLAVVPLSAAAAKAQANKEKAQNDAKTKANVATKTSSLAAMSTEKKGENEYRSSTGQIESLHVTVLDYPPC